MKADDNRKPKRPVRAVQRNEIREANLRTLAAQHNGLTALSKSLGFRNASFLSQMIHGRRPFTEKTARSIEEKLALPRNWLDALHDSNADRPETAAALEPALLSKCLVATRRSPGGMDLEDDVFAEIVSLTYERAQERGEVDRDCIAQLIRLTGGGSSDRKS